jgi:hypothetical protein
MDPSTIKPPDLRGRPRAKDSAALDHATGLVLRVCHLAGSASFVDDAREALVAEGVHVAVRTRNTAALFDWLVSILSYQGISDQVAFDYMERHGRATWQVIASDLRRAPSCPKLESYWQFHDCRYNKTRYTCAEPDHLPGCPLPNHWLRNGRLNQTAYALYLFIRDVAGGDLVGWIDRRLNTAAKHPGPDRLAPMRTAVLDPLKEVYGVSDKILMMALSVLFLGAPGRRRRWLDRRQHDRGRHPRAQFPAPDRDSAPVPSRPRLRRRLLPAGRLRRNHRDGRPQDRRQAVQPPVSEDLPAVRSVRDLAVLLPARSRHLQRQ